MKLELFHRMWLTPLHSFIHRNGSQVEILGNKCRTVNALVLLDTDKHCMAMFKEAYSTASVEPSKTLRIIIARSNTAAEHPLTLVAMTLAYRDDRSRGFAVVAREGSSRSTVFHRLHCTCKLYKIRDHRVRPSGSAVFVHCRGQLNTGDHPKCRQKHRLRWSFSANTWW